MQSAFKHCQYSMFKHVLLSGVNVNDHPEYIRPLLLQERASQKLALLNDRQSQIAASANELEADIKQE